MVPVYDGETLVGRCIESLLAQQGHTIEVVVVDDGSRDRSIDVAAAYPVRLLRRDHAGVSAARNAGLACATAPVIGFCDHDDEWHPTKVARQLEHLHQSGVVGVLCRQEIVLAPGVTRPSWLVPDERGDVGGVHPLSGLFRVDALTEIGGFDEDIRLGEDLDLLVRLREHGGEIVMLDDRLLVRHVHEHNMSHRLKSYTPGVFEVLRRHARRSRA